MGKVFTDAQRRELLNNYHERRGALWQTTKAGRLSIRSANEAMSWLVGVCNGLALAGHEVPTGLAMMASIRGVDAVMADIAKDIAENQPQAA